MPTYSYLCKSCGHHFDAVQSFSDPSLTVCPECGGELRKQYGSIGVTFNGSGFYRTDSRGSGSGSSSSSSDKGMSGSGDAGGSSVSTGSGAPAQKTSGSAASSSGSSSSTGSSS